MIPRELALRAAEWIESELEDLETSYTDSNGAWLVNSIADKRAHEDYMQGITIAAELRRHAGE